MISLRFSFHRFRVCLLACQLPCIPGSRWAQPLSGSKAKDPHVREKDASGTCFQPKVDICRLTSESKMRCVYSSFTFMIGCTDKDISWVKDVNNWTHVLDYFIIIIVISWYHVFSWYYEISCVSWVLMSHDCYHFPHPSLHSARLEDLAERHDTAQGQVTQTLQPYRVCENC